MSAVALKVCCIATIEEAELAVLWGASALGLVSEMPSGPGVIPDAQIAAIASSVPPDISTFLLTSSLDGNFIVAQHQQFKTDTIQLCDALEASQIEELQAALPGVNLVQVVHVVNRDAIGEAVAAARLTDALLLDSGDPKKRVKELGGTGRTHDWRVSREICARVQIPVYLAGGLNPDNVADAVRFVQPHGIDVCSGVRTDNRLDPDKLRRFASELQSSVP